MEYSGILVSRKVIEGGYIVMGCLIDQSGQYRSIVDIALDTQLNNGGVIAPAAILYPNGAWCVGLAHAVPAGTQCNYWEYRPLLSLDGVPCPGLSEAGLQTYDVTELPEFDQYIHGCVQQMAEYLHTNPDMCSAYYTYDEFFSGKTLNQIITDRQNAQQTTLTGVADVQQIAESNEPAAVQSEDTLTYSADIEAHKQPIAAVDFMTGKQCVSEHNESVEEPQSPETTDNSMPADVETEATAIEPMTTNDTVVAEHTATVAQQAVSVATDVGHTSVDMENLSCGDKLKAITTDNVFNMEYKYKHINLVGMSCTMDEVKNHGPKNFKAPLTDIEKYVIGVLSNGIDISFCEQPFLAYIEKHEDFKTIMNECADAFRHNDTCEFVSRGEHSNVMRAYNAFCGQLIRPSVLYPDIGDGRIINAQALDAITRVTGNMLYDMLSVNSRFLVVLLQMQVPVYQSYNGVYFQIYLSRVMHAINRIYAKLSEISLGSEDKLSNIFVEGTDEFKHMNDYTVGQLLADIDANVMLSYMKATVGIMVDDGDDEEDTSDNDDGNVRVSWTSEHQIALGATSFLVNEMIKNAGIVTEFMQANNGIVAQDNNGQKCYHRVYDTVSELISAYGYGRVPVGFPRNNLSFTQGVSMPDLKCNFLDTKVEFMYRDKPLLNDVIFYIADLYNRTVNAGVDDVETGAVVEAFWGVIDASPRLKELLFGLAYTQTANGESTYVLHHTEVPAHNSVFASIVHGMDADSVDTFKLICTELYGEYALQMFGDVAQIDLDADSDGTGRRRMSSAEYYGYFKVLWERANLEPGYNVEVLRRLMFGSERYLTLTMKESLIKTAYNLYSVQSLPSAAIQDKDWCLALEQLLYALTFGVDKEGLIPRVGELPEAAQSIYASVWNLIPHTYGNNKYSLEQIVTLAKMEKIQHFKNGDMYNTARRELARLTDSEVKKAEYEEAEDLMLIKSNIKYNVDYLVDFGAVMTRDPATGAALKNSDKIVSATLGFICSNGTDASSEEFLPVMGLRIPNTIAKYNYKFNIAEQINNLYKAMKTGTPEGKAMLKVFMNSSVLVNNLKRLGRELNEANALNWLNDEVFKFLRSDLDKSMLSDELPLQMNSPMFQGLSFADGTGRLSRMKIKSINRLYLKYLSYVVKTLDPVPNKVFTIKYLPINLSGTYEDKNNPSIRRYHYGEIQKSSDGSRIEYSPLYALKMVSNAQTIIRTIQTALNKKTNGTFSVHSVLRLSPLLTTSDDCDENGNRIELWKSVVPVLAPGDDEYMSEMNMLTLAFWSIFQLCYKKVTIDLK